MNSIYMQMLCDAARGGGVRVLQNSDHDYTAAWLVEHGFARWEFGRAAVRLTANGLTEIYRHLNGACLLDDVAYPATTPPRLRFRPAEAA